MFISYPEFDFCHWGHFLLLTRVLSALAHWSAIFAELDYLPLVAFPFIKLFQNNTLICFEVIATVLGKTSLLFSTFLFAWKILSSTFDISVTRSLRVKRNCGIFLLLILFFSLRLSSYLGTRCDKGVHFRTRVCVLGVRDTVTKYRCGRSFVLRQIPETEVNAQYILRKPSKLWIYCIFPVNWCQHWFEFFPNPPINVLSLTENILGYHDKELLQHFVKYEVTTQVSSWSSPLCCFYLIIDFLVCSVSKPVTIPFAGNSGAIPKVWGCNILTLSEQQSFCLGPASQSTKRQDVL